MGEDFQKKEEIKRNISEIYTRQPTQTTQMSSEG